MKFLAKSYLINLLALALLPHINYGFKISDRWQSYAWSAVVLTAINIFFKPFLKLLLLPLNILTLGFFAWTVNVVSVFFLVFITHQINIAGWDFPGLVLPFLIIPNLYLSPLINYIVVAIMLSAITKILNWICR